MRPLDPVQRNRYDRNLLVPEISEEGQQRLLAARVLVVGSGGLGSPALYYLCAAGVGALTIVDGDCVELSNLQRQILHATPDVGRPKTESAHQRLQALNPDCAVRGVQERLTGDNVARLVRDADVVLDCTDNFETRFVLADHCWHAGLTLVSAAVLRLQGYVFTVRPGAANPCFRCFLPDMPPPGTVRLPSEVGILGAVAGLFGTLQALEAIRLVLGMGHNLTRAIVRYDVVSGRFDEAVRVRDPDCPFCAERP
jgi:adenylyltransferase/sulfurtransferase